MKYRSVSMKSSIDSRERSLMFTRRTATVTISAPEASCACTITGLDGYLPVPMIRREVNVRPAIVSGSMRLPAADEVDDLDLVAVVDDFSAVERAADDGEVALDRDAAAVDAQRLQQGVDGLRCR